MGNSQMVCTTITPHTPYDILTDWILQIRSIGLRQIDSVKLDLDDTTKAKHRIQWN